MAQLLSTKNTASWPAAGVLHKQFSKFNLESILWLRLFHTAKKCCTATCIRATATPNRSLFGKPPGTSLTLRYGILLFKWIKRIGLAKIVPFISFKTTIRCSMLNIIRIIIKFTFMTFVFMCTNMSLLWFQEMILQFLSWPTCPEPEKMTGLHN